MSAVITLSSDEESESPPKKRIKPNFLGLGSIRITKVVSKKCPEEETAPKSISEILAEAKINKSISITPLTKYSNVVVLSDEEDVNDGVDSSSNAFKNVSSINLPGDCDSDDDCLIVSESQAKTVGEDVCKNVSSTSVSNNEQFDTCTGNNAKHVPPDSSVRIHSPVMVVPDSPEITRTEPEEVIDSSAKDTCTNIESSSDEDRQSESIRNGQSLNIAIGKAYSLDTFVEDDEENDKSVVEQLPSKPQMTEEPNEQETSIGAKETNSESITASPVTNSGGDASSSSKENDQEDITKPIPSSSSAESSHKQAQVSLIEVFLEACSKNVKSTQYEILTKKFEKLRSNYKKCEKELANSPYFLNMLEENTRRAEKSVVFSVMSFKEIFQHVKDFVDAGAIEVEPEQHRRLKKLEKTIKLLVKKIKKLEENEVDFDDEDDSTFIQLARYSDRLTKVHNKYCSLLKKNPYCGRLTHDKLVFVDSEHNEINRAISKRFRKKFPSYWEMENLIKSVSEEHNLKLSEQRIKAESSHCFKKLGELLQNRRKKELYEDHYHHIKDNEDPAARDTNLNLRLLESRQEGLLKIDKLCDEYVNKQDLGLEAADAEENISEKSSSEDSN